jgi:tetratricopeptide (TPR) repeat protein
LCAISQGLIRANQTAEAESWLQRALELSPECEAAHLMLGQLLSERLRTLELNSEERKALATKAVGSYSAVYRRNPAHKAAGNNLAWLLCSELNDPSEAYRIMQEVRIIKHSPKPMSGDMLAVEMLDTMALIYQKLNKPEYGNERIELFEAANRRYAEDPRIAVFLAQSYLAAGNGRRAMQVFQTARQLLPKFNLNNEQMGKLNQLIQQGIGDAQYKSN